MPVVWDTGRATDSGISTPEMAPSRTVENHLEPSPCPKCARMGEKSPNDGTIHLFCSDFFLLSTEHQLSS